MVRSATEARLNKNLKGMAKELMSVDPDMVLLQEVDLDSTRSYHVDECDRLADALPETDVSKALYYSVKFVPYPVPPCRSLDKPLAGANAKTFQHYMIDGFIASKNITIKSVKTRDLGFRHSDHNPVVLTAALN